jgi:molecular chaperone DnaK
MTAVSRGAAVFHYYKVNLISKGDMSIDVIPAMPQSIFLNVKNGFPITLIEAGTKAGTPKQYDNLLRVNSELGFELELYGGRSMFDPELKRLRNAKLIFPRGIERGTSVSLKVEYSDIGVLNFEAWLTNDKDIKIDVCLDDILTTQQEIEQLRKDINIERIRGVY